MAEDPKPSTSDLVNVDDGLGFEDDVNDSDFELDEDMMRILSSASASAKASKKAKKLQERLKKTPRR